MVNFIKCFPQLKHLFLIPCLFNISTVSEMNWIIIVPLMACLLLSLIGNIILVCRLRVRQNEYCVTEKCNAIVEAAPVKHLESPKIQPRKEKALLLFRRSEDVSDV